MPSTESSPAVSVVVLNYNTLDHTLACVESIYRHCCLPRDAYEIVVFDNGSDCFDAQSVAREFPEAQVMRSGHNLGYGRANNQAARASSGTYLLFLNNDTLLLNDVLSILLEFMEKNRDVAMCGAQQFGADMRPLRSYSFYPRLFHRVYRISVLKHFIVPAKYRIGGSRLHRPTEVEVLSGADLFVRRSFFDRIGGFDEGVFMYHEEEDLAVQARRMGMSLFLVPQAKIVHLGGKSSPDGTSRHKEDTLALMHYYRKHESVVAFGLLLCLVLLKYLQRWAKFLARRLVGKDLENRSRMYYELLVWGLRGFRKQECCSYGQLRAATDDEDTAVQR